MAANKAKSKIRGIVFGAHSTGLVRTIGIARAKAKIGLIKLVFNIRRLVTLERMAAAWKADFDQAGKDRGQVAAGGRADRARQVCRGCDPVDRRDRGRASVKFTDGSRSSSPPTVSQSAT